MAQTLLDEFKADYSLKNLTTFCIGGLARFFIEVHQVEKMQQVLAYCHQESLPFFILGKGSNILFDDQGFNGVVIANRIDFIAKPVEDIWHVGAGYSFSLLGTQTARQGWTGLEFASGIPASVGGAVFMNAGANGHETYETLQSVDYVNSKGEFQQLSAHDLQFSYRFSTFQKMRGAIVGATFKLKPSLSAREEQIKLIRYRTATQPYGSKSAGCVFRNPPENSAGALIDKVGLKGKTIGGAQVSTMHANFLINTGAASSKDIQQLLKYVQTTIKQEIGIDLESEIRYIPFQEQLINE